MHDRGLQQQTLSSSTKDKLRESRNAATSNQSPKLNLFSGLSTRGFQAGLPLKSLSLFSDLPVVAQGAKLIFTPTRNKYDSSVHSGSSSPTTLCYVTLTSASCVCAHVGYIHGGIYPTTCSEVLSDKCNRNITSVCSSVATHSPFNTGCSFWTLLSFLAALLVWGKTVKIFRREFNEGFNQSINQHFVHLLFFLNVVAFIVECVVNVRLIDIHESANIPLSTSWSYAELFNPDGLFFFYHQ